MQEEEHDDEKTIKELMRSKEIYEVDQDTYMVEPEEETEELGDYDLEEYNKEED